MNRYQSIVGRLNYWLFIAVAVLLPYPQIYLRYAIVIWFITWILEGRWLQIENLKYQLANWKYIVPILLFALWFGYKLLSGLWASNADAWHAQIERYLSFGLMIPVGLWGVSKHYNWKQAGRIFVISCMVAIPMYLLWMTILYKNPEWLESWRIKVGYPSKPVNGWWEFFEEYISLFKHRLYFCSVELFGAIVAWMVYRKKIGMLIPALIVTLSAIPLTYSRQGVITCAALLAIVLIYSMPHRYRWRYGLGILLAGIMIGGGILTFHPRMQEFNYKAITEIRDVSNTHDVRFNIWGAALQHPKDYLAHGLGAGQSWLYLIDRYNELGLNYYARVEYNCHNQYLEELLEGGIIGLVLFLLAWFSIPVCARSHNREFAWLFVILFLFNMMTECLFGRFDGVAIWAVGLIFILLQSYPHRKEQTPRNT